ncbi:hypothetical protein [Brevibacterium siliguriense]|uniref:hypothetical protein n=1 Tax=Brevibacterium siliguriense TaxID=1136497 RepID=UPI0012FD9540|nr:hypothetical protein [Brevibacterium siliguriense]
MALQRSTPTPLNRRTVLVGGSAVTLVGVAGCASADATRSSGTVDSTPTADEQRARPLKVDRTQAHQKVTVNSLTPLDDHPLYSPTRDGEPAAITPPDDAEASGHLTGIACTVFTASSPHG